MAKIYISFISHHPQTSLKTRDYLYDLSHPAEIKGEIEALGSHTHCSFILISGKSRGSRRWGLYTSGDAGRALLEQYIVNFSNIGCTLAIIGKKRVKESKL